MGPATTLASGRLSRRSPVVGADEAHRAAIGREKAEKPSIAIDNKRAVLSWPRRLKIRTASRHQCRRFRPTGPFSEVEGGTGQPLYTLADIDAKSRSIRRAVSSYSPRTVRAFPGKAE